MGAHQLLTSATRSIVLLLAVAVIAGQRSAFAQGSDGDDFGNSPPSAFSNFAEMQHLESASFKDFFSLKGWIKEYWADDATFRFCPMSTTSCKIVSGKDRAYNMYIDRALGKKVLRNTQVKDLKFAETEDSRAIFLQYRLLGTLEDGSELPGGVSQFTEWDYDQEGKVAHAELWSDKADLDGAEVLAGFS